MTYGVSRLFRLLLNLRGRCRRFAAMSLAISTVALAHPLPALATEDGDGVIEAGESESAELAKAAQNPVANLISLPIQNNTNFDYGPRDKIQNSLNIQPVWPFKLSQEWNLITRTILPIVSQPSVVSGQDRETGLGDTTFTAFLSPSDAGPLIWGVGPIFLLPTATDDRLGSDKWGMGPSVVLLGMPGPWVIGSLLSQVWSTGGSGDRNVSLFTWQPIANLNLKDGWYLSSVPVVTANWKAHKSGDTWTVPVGGGVGKIFRVGPMPLNARVQGFYNAARPDNVGRWSMQLQLQLMFPKRRP